MEALRQQRLAVVRQLEEASREAKRGRRNNANDRLGGFLLHGGVLTRPEAEIPLPRNDIESEV